MSEEKIAKEVAVLVARLEALVNALDQAEETDPPNKAYPPASETDIATAEKQLKFKFPPSYRAFLKIHNGWRGLWVWSIFGVSGPGFTAPRKEYERDLKIFEKISNRQGPGHIDRLKETEADDPKIIYLPNHPPVALNYDQTYLIFDRHRFEKGGEFEVAVVDRGEVVNHRYPGFIQFLEKMIKDVGGELRDNGVDPSSADPAAKGQGKKRS